MKGWVLMVVALLSCAAGAGEKAFTVRPTELKAKPSIDATTLATLPELSEVEILTRQFSWMQVRAPSGSGWLKMLSLRMGSQQAIVKKVVPLKQEMFEAAVKGSSRSNTGTVVKGLHTAGAKTGVQEPNPDQPDVLQPDEIYESDSPDDTYDPAVVDAARMWGGNGGKLKNARPAALASDAGVDLSLSRVQAKQFAKAGKLSMQSVTYLHPRHGLGLNLTDPSLELALGGSIGSSIRDAAAAVQSAKLQHYVNDVGLWLAMQTERPDLPWHFVVLEGEEVFVFPVPGGQVFLSRGLLRRLQGEQELAAVLAQAIAHTVKGHHLWAIMKRAGATQLATLGHELSQKGEMPTLTKLTAFGLELYANGLKDDDVFEADSMAVVVAARAGYDPYALPAVLQTLQTFGPRDLNLALVRKTQPLLSGRLDALEGPMTDKLRFVENQPDLSVRFKLAVGDVVGK